MRPREEAHHRGERPLRAANGASIPALRRFADYEGIVIDLDARVLGASAEGSAMPGDYRFEGGTSLRAKSEGVGCFVKMALGTG